MSKSNLELVKGFHEAFGHFIADELTLPDEQTVTFRHKFLREEITELDEAVKEESIVKIADAFGDIQYVLDGYFLNTGLWKYKDAIMEEINRSNMTKSCQDLDQVDASIEHLESLSNGDHYHVEKISGNWIIYNQDKKVQKPLGYSKPDLYKVLGINKPSL